MAQGWPWFVPSLVGIRSAPLVRCLGVSTNPVAGDPPPLYRSLVGAGSHWGAGHRFGWFVGMSKTMGIWLSRRARRSSRTTLSAWMEGLAWNR